MTESLSLVLPCRNQADHIGQILPRYVHALEDAGMPFELVVVPNASTDHTPAIVEELACLEPRIKVVFNAAGGWGRSVRVGLNAATGTVLAYTNTARTDPESMPGFIDSFFAAGRCVLKAYRFDRGDTMRALGSLLYNLEARLLFRLGCRDVNGTPKVFGRDLYRQIDLRSDGDLIDLELLSAAARLQYAIVEKPVQGFHRHGGKSSTTLKSAWKMYSGAVRFWWKHNAA